MTLLSGTLAVERVPVRAEMPERKSLLEAGCPAGVASPAMVGGGRNYYLLESLTHLGGSFSFSMGLFGTRDTQRYALRLLHHLILPLDESGFLSETSGLQENE